MSQEVVKVRKPIRGSKNEPKWLITDINRSRLAMVPEAVIPRHVKERMKNVDQAFFMASYSVITGWSISDTVVADPGW